jgi:Docking domain of Afi1 for Arf3 in vesicle trafficking
MNIVLIGAEFDIEKGSSISFKYPSNAEIDEDDQTLAELMLPEGSHLHQEDSTYFILNRKKVFRKNTLLDAKKSKLTMDGTCFTHNQSWKPLHPSVLSIQLTGSMLSINLQKTVEYELNGETILYNRSPLVYFPNTVPRLAIRFCSVDDRIYFTEFLHG